MGLGWGGGWGGISDDAGIYMASTDGMTEVWNGIQPKRDTHGRCDPVGNSIKMSENTLYWMTDLTPHAALPSMIDGKRQFIRIVSPQVDVWYKKHSTENPFGIKPNATIIDVDKFTI